MACCIFPPPSTLTWPSSTPNSALFPPKRSRSRSRSRSLRPPPLAASSSSGDPESPDVPASIKLAMKRAREYKKNKRIPTDDKPSSSALEPEQNRTTTDGNTRSPEVPDAVNLPMERALEFEKNEGVLNISTEEIAGQEKMKASNPREEIVENKMNKEKLRVSSTDFLGFGFSDKKWYRGTPPGLIPSVESFSEGELSDVEFIVGDASKFDTTTPSNISSDKYKDDSELYKPKVSTWGVFPRPNNISKAFGGGRVIRPGEDYETEEDKKARDKRTRELISAYKKKTGITIDPKTKAECEKALNEGDKLMDLGKLREALPLYEKVMSGLVFQSELHGLAALQWSICQDSLCRTNEAKLMYEKLQSHPNGKVSKQAKQFVFSFQAMEMLKVNNSSYSRKTGYEDYFEAFVGNKVNYTPEEEEKDEGVLRQGLPYIMFLVSPIFIVFLIAAKKTFRF